MGKWGVSCFLFVNGVVKIVNKAGIERAAQKGGEVDQGDTVISAPGASAQIEMIDQGFLAVRPSTRLRFDAYVYHERGNGTERALLSLLEGGFRTITGLIGKLHKENYRIQTPNATIGIRGTDHEPMYIPPGETKLGAPGTYDKVNVGIAYIQTPQGTVDIGANQVGFAAPGQIPRILPSIPQFYISLAAPPPRWKREQERRDGERTESRQATARQSGDTASDLGKEKNPQGQVNARPDVSGHGGPGLGQDAVKTLDSSVLSQGKGQAFDDSGKGSSLGVSGSVSGPGPSLPNPLQGSGQGLTDAIRGLSVPGKLK